jgi:signal transduction histidine kinase
MRRPRALKYVRRRTPVGEQAHPRSAAECVKLSANGVNDVSLSTTSLEPRVLSAFRWLYALMFGLILLGFLSPGPLPDYFALVLCLMSGAMAAYLSSHWLARRLKGWYLPLAVMVMAFVPVLADVGATAVYASQGLAPDGLRGDGSRLYFWLIPPLIMVSAHYSLRVVLLLTISTSLLPLLLITWVDRTLLSDQVTNAAVRLILYTVVGYLVVRTSAAQRDQQRELALKNAQLADYAATLEQLTIARERNRLARELHDTLAHTLSALNVQLKALEVLWEQEPSAARKALRDTQEMTREGLNEARRALVALRAAPVEELGLVAALARLAQQAAERAGLRLTLALPDQVAGVTPQVEQHLYRIAEEALSNVARHAHARCITLGLEQRAGMLRLSVSDDGVGFSPDEAQRQEGHFGLVGMQERALILNGRLTVDSQPGKGTRLTFDLPVP